MKPLIGPADAKAILSSREPLTNTQRNLVLDRIHQLERDIASIQHAACVAARDRDALHALIVNDGHAMTFQTLGQFRASLMKVASQRQEKEIAK